MSSQVLADSIDPEKLSQLAPVEFTAPMLCYVVKKTGPASSTEEASFSAAQQASVGGLAALFVCYATSPSTSRSATSGSAITSAASHKDKKASDHDMSSVERRLMDEGTRMAGRCGRFRKSDEASECNNSWIHGGMGFPFSTSAYALGGDAPMEQPHYRPFLGGMKTGRAFL
ncbi:unnamed protein product [Amoebophrya sp. A25]|nr:unnamed protein product [Amoebophrya sp. A25]|eukprot:GSA25T00022929001.1